MRDFTKTPLSDTCISVLRRAVADGSIFFEMRTGDASVFRKLVDLGYLKKAKKVTLVYLPTPEGRKFISDTKV
jgi:hypothetical protein